MPNWKKLVVSGSDASLQSLNVSTAFTSSGIKYPPTDGTSGQIISTDGEGNLSFIDATGGLGVTTKLYQTSSAETWSFAHNLGEMYPVVNIYDSNNELIIPQTVDAIDNNNMSIVFSSPRTGVAVAVVGGVAVSASFSTYALTASYAISASYEINYETSSSYAETASVALTAISASWAPTQISGSYATSASYAVTASYATSVGVNFEQITSSSVWVITHNLNNRYPSVQVYDENHEVFIPQRIYGTSVNETQIEFSFPCTGYARII
jgi:hypothetical protein